MFLLPLLGRWFSPTRIIILVIAGAIILVSVLFFFSIKGWLEENDKKLQNLAADKLKLEMVTQTQALANSSMAENIERWKAANIKLQQDLSKQQATVQRVAREKQVLIETISSYNVSSEITKDPVNAARIANTLSADSFKLFECITAGANSCSVGDGSPAKNGSASSAPTNLIRPN